MYMSLIYFPGKTTDNGTKTPHTPRTAALPRKSLSGGQGRGGQGGWQYKYLSLISFFVSVHVCMFGEIGQSCTFGILLAIISQ